MSSTSNVCAFRSCRHTVRSDYPYAPYCYDHRGHSDQYTSLSIQAAENSGDLRLDSPKSSSSSGMQDAQFYSQYTDIYPHDSHHVVSAVRHWCNDEDLSVPRNALQKMNSAAWELRHHLVQEGIDERRVARLHVMGMNRQTQNKKRQYDDEYDHNVVLLDPDTQHEVVVDPVISVFAPTYQPSQPVEQELSSGETPFGDVPWVGSREQYVHGHHLWWNHNEVLPW